MGPAWGTPSPSETLPRDELQMGAGLRHRQSLGVFQAYNLLGTQEQGQPCMSWVTQAQGPVRLVDAILHGRSSGRRSRMGDTGQT